LSHDAEKSCPLLGETRTHVTGSVWPCSTCAGAAASVFQMMMCLSLEPDRASPAAVMPTAPTKCVWPLSVCVHVAEAPSADSLSTFHTRTVASREPVMTWPSANGPTDRTSCSWPVRMAESWKGSVGIGSAADMERPDE